MISSLVKRSRRYAHVIHSITRDALRGNRRLVILALLANMLGVGCMAGSIGAVLTYVRLAETGDELSLGPYTFAADGQLSSMLALGIVAGVLGLLAGWLLFAAQRLIYTSTRRYYRVCIKRAISHASEPHGPAWCDDLGTHPHQTLMRLTGSAALFSALTFRDVQQMILPVLVGIFAGVVVFIIEPLFTLGLLVVLAVYLVPTYRLNRASFRYQRDYLHLQPTVRRPVSIGINKVLNQSQPHHVKQQWSAHALEHTPYETTMDAYFGRLLCNARMQLVNTSLMIFCVCLIFVYFGYLIQQGERGWAALLIYLTALRFAINSLRPISSHFIKLSQFFSESEFYHRFMRSYARGKTLLKRAAAEPVTKPVTIEGQDLVGGHHTLTIQPGGLVVVYLAPPAGHMDMQQMMWRLRPLVGNSTALAWLQRSAIMAITDHHDDTADSEQDATASSAQADAHQAPVLVIDARLLLTNKASRKMQAGAAEASRASRELLLVVSDRAKPVQRLARRAGYKTVDAVLVVEAQRTIISISDQSWAEAHQERIAQALAKVSDDQTSDAELELED